MDIRAAMAELAGVSTAWPPARPIREGLALPRLDWAAIAVFGALQAWWIFTHSPWIDEAKALLIAREPWTELRRNLSYEGHPALWYLWLGVVDRALGGSRFSLAAAQLPIGIALSALLWLRAPYPRLAKLLLSVSYWFTLEYGVIARSYGLGVLLVLASVPLRGSLWGWVCLALAANTASHVAMAALALGGVYFLWRPQIMGPVILAAGVLVSIVSVFPLAPDLHLGSELAGESLTNRIALGVWEASAALVPAAPEWPYVWGRPLPGEVGLVLGLGVLPLGLVTLKGDWRARIGFAVLYFGLIAFGGSVYRLYPRHVGVLFAFLLAAWWMARDRGGKLNFAAWGWLAAAAVCGMPFVLTSQTPFTHAKAMGAWVRAHGLQDETWAAWPGASGMLLSVETGRPTFNLEKGCLNSFTRGDRVLKPVDRWAAVQAAGARYVVSQKPIPQGRLLAQFGGGAGNDPPALLYAFAVAPRPAPSCP